MNRNLRTSVSLFSGAGFGDMGFEAAGFNHDLLCEIDPSRTAFTSQNFPNAKVLTVDIAKNVEKINTEIQSLLTKTQEQNLFLLYATPPCQGMSKNGIGTILKAMDGGKRPSVDKRNKLYLPVIEIVKLNKPKWIFFENVCRLFNFKDIDSNGNIRTLPEIIEDAFYKLGYVGKFELVQIADYGLPQTRSRSVGIFRQKEGTNFSENCSFLPPKIIDKPENRITLRDVISNCESLDSLKHETRISEHNSLHRVPKWREELYHWMKHTSEGASAFDNNECVNCGHINEKDDIDCSKCNEALPKPTVTKGGKRKKIKGFVSAYKRMYWDKPASTITTRSAYACSDHKAHPNENRVLSIYEIALLQGIDIEKVKWTNETGTQFPDTLLRELIGESVPPLFTKIVGEHIVKIENEILLNKKEQ
jgi:DNA (cytosine-5)-methyltransferase 1